MQVKRWSGNVAVLSVPTVNARLPAWCRACKHPVKHTTTGLFPLSLFVVSTFSSARLGQHNTPKVKVCLRGFRYSFALPYTGTDRHVGSAVPHAASKALCVPRASSRAQVSQNEIGDVARGGDLRFHARHGTLERVGVVQLVWCIPEKRSGGGRNQHTSTADMGRGNVGYRGA